MGDSADTAREKLGKRTTPRPVPKTRAQKRRDAEDARNFGASTAIFVPPALQSEGKKTPVSVIVKPVPETTAQRHARENAQRVQRERSRVGLPMTGPTGRNNLDAAPSGFDVAKARLTSPPAQWGEGSETLRYWRQQQIRKDGNLSPAEKRQLEAWTEQQFQGNRTSIIPALKIGLEVGKSLGVPLMRLMADASPGTVGAMRVPGGIKGYTQEQREKDYEALLGKALTNLVLHGDVPNTGGQAAGLGLGIAGILPIGKLTALARAGRAARAAGNAVKVADTPARQAFHAAVAQRIGEEQAADVMAVVDQVAANAARNPDVEHITSPEQWYEVTSARAGSAEDFMQSPAAKYALLQTEPGRRYGLVEGAPQPEATPVTKAFVYPKAAFKAIHTDGETVQFSGGNRLGKITVRRVPGEGAAKYEVSIEGREPVVMDMAQTRALIKDGYNHAIVTARELPFANETPVFRTPDLVAEGKKLPTKLVPRNGEKVESFSMPKAQLEATLKKKIKPAEWEDSKMQDFFDTYLSNELIPKADWDSHLASPLNAYDLDEVIRASPSQDFPTVYGSGSRQYAGLTVRDDSLREPYFEITMQLRKPLHQRVSRGVMEQRRRDAPYLMKGSAHWNETDVVAHVRFHIITDADGKKALLVDEIQSDWASDWRRLQSMGGRGVIRRRVDEIEQEQAAIQQEIDRQGGYFNMDYAERKAYDDKLDDLLREREMLVKYEEQVPGPPPLGKKQMEAAVRRVLRFAQEEDVDRIIIVPADVQTVRNVAFKKTPKGRDTGMSDATTWSDYDDALRRWKEDTEGMTQEEVKAYALDPAHADDPMVKTFNRLYGSRENPKGEVQAVFEKEMGVQGGFRESIFSGGYADQFGVIKRPASGTVGDAKKFKGRWWDANPDYQPGYPLEIGDVVRTTDGKIGTVVSKQGRTYVVKTQGESLHDLYELTKQIEVQQPRTLHNPGNMDGYVIEMTPEAKAKAAKPMAYYQQRQWEKLPKGAAELLGDGTRVIHLFENADISTVLHELAHVSLADLSEVDRAILSRNFGGFRTRADHEAYARAFERYMYEGQAMTSELDGTFAKVKQWMANVYQHVNRIGAHVNPEVKQVFDRMVVRPETPAEQLVRMLQGAPAIRKEQEALYSQERARRIGNAMEALTASDDSLEGFYSALTELKGELPKIGFTGLDELSPEALDSLLNTIRLHPFVRPYQKIQAMDAIIQATRGVVPTTSELLLLEKIFGKSVGFRKKLHPTGMGAAFVEIWNIPRSFAASFDLSAPLRQGIVAGFRHPILFKRNIMPMIKSIKASKYEDYAEEIANRPTYPLMKRGKLAVDTSASDADFAMREEAFYSSYADKLPGVKHSARAYETFLHKMRADIFDAMLEKASNPGWVRRHLGKPIDPTSDEFLQGLGRYVNSITGRGVLPENVLFPAETAAPLLNTIFFSPRLLASRVNLISPRYYYQLWKADPMLAQEAMRAMIQSVAGTVSMLAVASQMPGVDVGLDPTSANFGKIRVGDTRVDTLAGFGPLAVLIARMITGKSTSSTTGKTQNLEGGFGASSHYDILQRFAESKFAPTTGMLRDIAKHQTFIGQELGWDRESAWIMGQNMIPMMFRDAVEVAKEPASPEEAAAAFATVVVLGGLGIGFSSYPDRKPKVKLGRPTAPGDGGLPAGWDDAPAGGGDTGGGGLPVGW